MKNSKTYALLNTLALLLTLTVNALANILPINNLNTGEVSSLYPNLFTPAGYTFSIWSVIYLLLTGFVIYQWRSVLKNNNTRTFNAITPMFVISSLLNALWIIVWHHLFVGLSVVVMLALLITLIVIFLKLRSHVERSNADRYLIHLTFTFYLAWICVATIANIAAFLTALNWDGGFIIPEAWTIIMMSIAAALAYFITVRFKVPGFALVVMWALAGILSRWSGSNYTLIVYGGLVLIMILAILYIRMIFFNRKLKV
jgi:translocator protein